MQLSKKFLKKINPTEDEIKECKHVAYIIKDHGREIELLHGPSQWTYNEEKEVSTLRDPRIWEEINEITFFQLIEQSANYFNNETHAQDQEMSQLIQKFEIGEDTMCLSDPDHTEAPKEEETKIIVKKSSKAGNIRNKANLLNQKVSSLQTRMDDTRKNLQRITGSKNALMQAKLKDIKKISERLNDMLSSINIYLGNEEQFHIIKYGKPAPAETQITLRQRMLFMDIECMIEIQDEGLTLEKIEEFDQWILKPGNLENILPEEKGVIALRLKQKRRAYKNDDEDVTHYLLLKNGERLYRYQTELKFSRLIPKKIDVENIFRERDVFSKKTETIRPGTRKYSEALEKADSQQVEFLKIALAIQGIFDRTRIFHPFATPNTPNVMDFDNPEFNFIRDEESGIKDKKFPSFCTWIKTVNMTLCAKSRVVGAFSKHYNSYTGYDNDARFLSNQNQSMPPRESIFITEEHASGFCIKYAEDHRKRRVSFKLDTNEPEFINIDSADITDEALDFYSKDRDSRQSHPSLSGVGLQMMKKLRNTEYNQEQPFRELLTKKLFEIHNLEFPKEEIKFFIKCYKTKYRSFDPIYTQNDIALKRILKIAENQKNITKWAEKNQKHLSVEILNTIENEVKETKLIGIYLKDQKHIRVYRSHAPEHASFVTIDEYLFKKGTWALNSRKEWTSLTFNKRPKLLWVQLREDIKLLEHTPLQTSSIPKPDFLKLYPKITELVKNSNDEAVVALVVDPKSQNFFVIIQSKNRSAWSRTETPIKGLHYNNEYQTEKKNISVIPSPEGYKFELNSYTHRCIELKDIPKENILWENEKALQTIAKQELKSKKYEDLYKSGITLALEVSNAFEKQAFETWKAQQYNAYLKDEGDPELFDTHLKTIPDYKVESQHIGQVIWAMYAKALQQGHKTLCQAYPQGIKYQDLYQESQNPDIQELINQLTNQFGDHGKFKSSQKDDWSDKVNMQEFIYMYNGTLIQATPNWSQKSESE
jgi:hypothetical protein